MSEWIPVSERLPECDEEVLVASLDGYCTLRHALTLRSQYQSGIDDGDGCYWTHWMPLPEPPKG